MRALTAARRWAKTRRTSAQITLVYAYNRWYAIASGHEISGAIRVRGGTLVGFGETPADALRQCAELLEEIEAAHRLDTTTRGW